MKLKLYLIKFINAVRSKLPQGDCNTHLLVRAASNGINFYQKALSKPIGKFLDYFGFVRNNSCIFYPTCSEYTKQAIIKYGLLKGFYLGFLRILRCHPWQKNHIDPLK